MTLRPGNYNKRNTRKAWLTCVETPKFLLALYFQALIFKVKFLEAGGSTTASFDADCRQLQFNLSFKCIQILMNLKHYFKRTFPILILEII